MPQYQLRFLDGEGRLIGRAAFQAMNHEEAQRAAQDLGDPRRKELWCDGRRIWVGTTGPAPPRRMTLRRRTAIAATSAPSMRMSWSAPRQ